MKTIHKILLIATAILLMSGCTAFERRDYESRIAEVSEVYPTEKVSDLFKKFPNGFEIYHREKESVDGKYLYDHEIVLVGNPNTQTITGKYKKKDMQDRTMVDIPVSYDMNNSLTTSEDYQFDDIVKNMKLLFMILNLNKVNREKLEYIGLYSNPSLGTYNIRYNIVDSQLNEYLQLPLNKKMEITFGGSKDSENSNNYQINIWIKRDLTDYLSEQVIGY
ncbi:hypothetical protein K6V78_10845 [Streptococcus gallolyticus]|nr:hypothetical protein [Streptococcus gallolyticus]MBY5042054.1 hypothetical protein [Streptococcus gallolyticus]